MKEQSSSNSQLSSQILNELKRLLRQNEVPYKKLAQYLKISESGLKKTMNSSDCSISRLEQICHYLGLRLTDIIHDLEDQNLRDVSFTYDQEHYFLSNWSGFLVYWLLVYETRGTEEVMQLTGLKKKEFSQIVFRLDALRLLALLPGDRIKVPHPQGIRWVGKTKFITELYLKWSHQLVEQAIKSGWSDECYFRVRYLKMTDATWEELKAVMAKTDLIYTNRASREMRLKRNDLRHVRWLMIADNASWAEQELKRLPKTKPGT